MKYTGSIALFCCLAMAVYLFAERSTGRSLRRVGVVQMHKLVYEFKGMKDAGARYGEQMKRWDAEADSLQRVLAGVLQQARRDSSARKAGPAQTGFARFKEQRRALAEFLQAHEAMAAEQDKQMTLGVINQLNTYMKEFAERKGYDLVLCNNSEQQSVGYLAEGLDITQALLDFSNQRYDGKN